MNQLKHIEINIGKACNNKCRFCMSSKSELWDIKFVPLETLKEKIKGYADNSYKSIGFLGGDISIHPKIIEIIAYCREVGFININAISNGMKFDDIEFAKKAVEAGLTRVNFSIHSHLPEVEDYLIQVSGGLERKLKAIDNIKSLHNLGLLRDDLSINIVLNSKNLPTIVESILYFNKIKKVNDFRINFIWLNDDTKENWEDLRISYTEFFPYLKKLVYLSIKYNIRITFDTVPACILYKIDSVNHKTIIKKFLGEDYDHITEIDHINNNDQFDWKKRKKDMLKMQFDPCKKCAYSTSCQGVRKHYGEIYGGNEFEPILREFDSKPIENIQIITENYEERDIKYYYNKIEEGKNDEIRDEILHFYNKYRDERFGNLYAVFLSKEKKFNEAIKILKEILESNKKVFDIGNIYYNIAINYINLSDEENSSLYLEKSKEYLGEEEYFKEVYNNFYLNIKKYTIIDFEEKIKNYYKENNEEKLKKFLYIENLIDNL